MRQLEPIPECTPEKKADFREIRETMKKWQRILAVIETGEDAYPSPAEFERDHRTATGVILELKEMASEIMNRKHH